MLPDSEHPARALHVPDGRREAELHAQARREVEVLVAVDLVDEPPRDPVRAFPRDARREEQEPAVNGFLGRRRAEAAGAELDVAPLDGSEETHDGVGIAGHQAPARHEQVALLLLPHGRLLASGVELRVEVREPRRALEGPLDVERVERAPQRELEELAVGEIRGVEPEGHVRSEQVRVDEEERPGRAVRLLLPSESELAAGSEQVVLLGSDRVRRHAALVRERAAQEERPRVGRLDDDARALRAHVGPAEEPERAEVALRLGEEVRAKLVARLEEELFLDERRAGREVEGVREPVGKERFRRLLGREDVRRPDLDRVDAWSLLRRQAAAEKPEEHRGRRAGRQRTACQLFEGFQRGSGSCRVFAAQRPSTKSRSERRLR